MTWDTSAKWRWLLKAMLVATGRMSPIWVHSRAMYFFSREPTPRISESVRAEWVRENKREYTSLGSFGHTPPVPTTSRPYPKSPRCNLLYVTTMFFEVHQGSMSIL